MFKINLWELEQKPILRLALSGLRIGYRRTMASESNNYKHLFTWTCEIDKLGKSVGAQPLRIRLSLRGKLGSKIMNLQYKKTLHQQNCYHL